MKQKKKVEDRNIKTGNAQLIGQQEQQNDYFSVISKDDVLLAVLADGRTKRKTGKLAAVITVDTLKVDFMKDLYTLQGVDTYFLNAFYKINQRLKEIACGNNIGATLIAMIIEHNHLYYASVGDCLFYLYRKKELMRVNDIYKDKIEIKKMLLEQGDIIMLCTKGAYESLTEMEIIDELSKKINPYKKCLHFVKCILNKQYSYQDNATIIILENEVSKVSFWRKCYEKIK